MGSLHFPSNNRQIIGTYESDGKFNTAESKDLKARLEAEVAQWGSVEDPF